MGLVRVLGSFQTGFGRFDQELWLKPVQNWLRNPYQPHMNWSGPGQDWSEWPKWPIWAPEPLWPKGLKTWSKREPKS